MRFGYSAAIVSVVFGLSACGQDSSTTVQKDAPTRISDATPVATPAPVVPLPSLPEFAPLYPGAMLQARMTGNRVRREGSTVFFRTNAPPAEIISFYKRKAVEAGMGQGSNMSRGTNMMYWARNDSATVQIYAVKVPEGTDVQIFWSHGG